MTLEQITLDSTPDLNDVKAVLVELQGLTVSVASGAAAAADINVTGITTSDTLVAVLRLDHATSLLSSLTAEASITGAGHIRNSTTDTTGDTLLVVWFNKS